LSKNAGSQRCSTDASRADVADGILALGRQRRFTSHTLPGLHSASSAMLFLDARSLAAGQWRVAGKLVDRIDIGLAREPVFELGLYVVEHIDDQHVVVLEGKVGLIALLAHIQQNARGLRADDLPASLLNGVREGGG